MDFRRNPTGEILAQIRAFASVIDRGAVFYFVTIWK